MNKKVASAVLIGSLLAAALVLSCRNPLDVGLGDNVDLQSPDVKVVSHGNGAYVRATINLTGTYADDFKNVTVKVSLDGGGTFANATVNTTARTWAYTINTTSYADGGRDLLIRVIDGSGKSVEKRLLLYFDNTPPVVLVKVPLGYVYPPNEYNGNVAIRGDATDQFPIDHVAVVVHNSLGAALDSKNADGSNSWSYTFDSLAHVPNVESCTVTIEAYDRAGNKSSAVYHIADVTTVNGGVPLTVEQVATILAGPSSPAKTAIAGVALASMPLRINQGLDLPVFDIYNPDPAAPPADKILAPTSKAIGMVTDDAEGINVSTIAIQLDGGAWTPVTTTVGTGLAVRWEHSLVGLSTGDHTLRVRASDNGGAQGYSATVSFSIDAGAPTVEITSPTQGAYLNSTSFAVHGTADVASGTVTSVAVSTDGGVSYSPATSDTGDYDTWTYNVSGVAADVVNIKAKATTVTSVAYYNLQVIVDTQMPTVAFLSPTKSSSVNGPVTVRGSSSDNRQITKVELRIGEPASWIVLADPYNWDYLFDTAGYANSTYATESPPGSNIWKLNVYARITDIAGNVKTTDATTYYFFIDQELDKPRITVISPPAGTANVAGPLMISGTALDDDGLYLVEIQIDVNGDGDFADAIDFWNGSSKTHDADTNDRFEREDTWYPATGTSLWSQQINAYGEMYQTEPGHDGNIIVRVRGVDTKDGGLSRGIEGDVTEFSVHLDNTIPRIESLNLVSGEFVKGLFSITGSALDDNQVASVQISYDGGINYQNLPVGTYTVNTVSDWSLNLPIDTTPTGLNLSSGILYLRLKITDNANYQSITSLNLNVDNVYPTDDPSGYTGAASDINGPAARVQGTARDGGTVSGIEEIEVYLVRGATMYNPSTGGTAAVGSHNFGDGSGPVPYPTGAGSESFKVTINDTNELGNDSGGNGDGDGFDESLTLAGSTYNWWAELDSTLIPDGAIDIHYVVFDNAGNGTHRQAAGFVKNHKPSITSVTVGSDVDQSGVVEADERFTYTASFKARNRLYIGINATDDQPIAGYEVIRDPSGSAQVVSTAATSTIDVSGYSDGAVTFLCRVTDSVGITAETTLSVTIENNDLVPPSITFSPLVQAQVVAGHLEESGASLHDGVDPDVSGAIALAGTASDNQRIERITVQIDAFDPDGAGALVAGDERTVAQWSGTSLVSTDAAFVIGSQTLSEAGGHQVAWTYTWNSAAITSVAANNIVVRFRARDFFPSTALDNRTVDVVPYITGVTRTLTTNRSQHGHFAVQEGETGVVISGYNLAQTGTNWVRVYNTGGTASDTVTVTASGSPYTSMTVSLAGVTHSGFLRLAVNGVEATNNVNNNALATNKEDDGHGIGSTLWNDDRYLRVWAVGASFTGSSTPEHPSMSIGADGTLYGAWINYASSLMTSGTVGTGPFTQWGIYDPPEYTDVYVDASEATLKYAIAFAANHYGGSGWGTNYPLDVSRAGFVGVRTPNSRPWANDNGGGLDYPNAYAYPVESLNLNQQLWQFNRPKIVRSDGGASDAQDRIHTAYYDANTRAAKYSFMLDDGQATARGWIVLDGSTDAQDVRYVTGIATRPSMTTLNDPALNGNAMIVNGQTIMLLDTNGQAFWTTISSGAGTSTLTLAGGTSTTRTHYTIITATSNLVTGGVAQSSAAGEYVAIDVDENGLPVVLYYNNAAQTLRLARATSTNPTSPSDWTRQNVFSVGDPNAQFSGQYVTMKFDASGGLHVVCYRTSSGDLLYLYAPDADGTDDYVFQNSVVIDSDGAVGTWADITLNGTTPYISYLNNSMTGTFEGLKLAYYDTGLAAWEYEVLPLNAAVANKRTNIEYRRGSVAWTVAVSYASDNFNVVYLRPEE
jgi:large repetitive protein